MASFSTEAIYEHTQIYLSRTTLRFILLDGGDLLDTLCVVEPGVPVDFGR